MLIIFAIFGFISWHATFADDIFPAVIITQEGENLAFQKSWIKMNRCHANGSDLQEISMYRFYSNNGRAHYLILCHKWCAHYSRAPIIRGRLLLYSPYLYDARQFIRTVNAPGTTTWKPQTLKIKGFLWALFLNSL